VPALRDRGSDVLQLASHFLRSASKRSGKGVLQLSVPLAERMMSYEWPGNVRELQNCIERAVALARFDHLTIEDMPEKIRAYKAGGFAVLANDVDEIVTIDELERRYITRVMKLLNGNRARTAKKLGLDRRTLERMLQRYSAKHPGSIDLANTPDDDGAKDDTTSPESVDDAPTAADASHESAALANDDEPTVR
jgi:two-component system response regulator HydG